MGVPSDLTKDNMRPKIQTNEVVQFKSDDRKDMYK